MVKGYQCPNHGYVRECDVSEAGERICRECGTAVTGITGRTRGRRAPPSDQPMHQAGTIMWEGFVGYTGGRRITVEAFSFEDAADALIDKAGDEAVAEIRPSRREYRS